MNSIKKITLFVVVLFSLSMYAGDKDSLKTEIKRDIQVGLTSRVVGGNVYFTLLMLNESKPGVYSMVKEFEDGSFESVGIQEIGVNTINQPIMYCFSDESKVVPLSYKLVRISYDVESIKTWYCSDLGDGICVDEVIIAIE